jgi:hypothetical protein
MIGIPALGKLGMRQVTRQQRIFLRISFPGSGKLPIRQVNRHHMIQDILTNALRTAFRDLASCWSTGII